MIKMTHKIEKEIDALLVPIMQGFIWSSNIISVFYILLGAFCVQSPIFFK
jgi:hypothetical protein